MMKDRRRVSKMEGRTNFSRRLQAVRNWNCLENWQNHQDDGNPKRRSIH